MQQSLTANGIRLSFRDFGGQGPGVLLLHGLFGRATTYADTAGWLTSQYHVVGLDQRGHGWSDKPENAYTRDHYVEDAAAVIQQLGLGPAIVIGHSMGALNAWVLAARYPGLVRALVLEDMTAATARPEPGEWVRNWLGEWPVPFPTMASVRTYFNRIRPSMGEYFTEVMVERQDGYRPQFDPEHMYQASAQIDARDHWQEIDLIRCPTLVVKGAESDCSRADLQEMARRIPGGRYVEIPQAGHVVHYDQPVAWRVAVESFLQGLQSDTGRPLKC